MSSTPGLVAELEAKVRAFPDPRGDTPGRRIFTRGAAPAGRPRDAVRWHSLDDLDA